MERLLDAALPDAEFVALLEQAVMVVYTSVDQNQRNMAQSILTELQTKPDAWVRCDKILDSPSATSSSRFYGLQIMDNMIRYRWKTLPRQTCEQVRDFIVKKVIELSSNEETLQRERMLIGKLNLILVQVVKQEWPAHWRGFISEIVGASKSSVPLCENNMHILALLSEEVFEFSSGQMVSDKITELKTQFNDEFSSVFELCQYVFGQAADIKDSRPSLLVATLKTLERFLSWIPLGYIFETNLIETLVSFVLQPSLRLHALRCLVEIGSLTAGSVYDARFVVLYVSFMTNLTSVLPPGTDIAASYVDADDETQGFVMDLALFFAGFFKNHLNILEREDGDLRQALRIGCEYLVKISQVEEVEVFKACLEWWHHIAQDLYEASNVMHVPSRALALGVPVIAQDPGNPRRLFYAPALSQVRRIMISRMAKPEEVLIVEDENGEIVRETTKDTDAIALYKTMRETLVFLTHLDVRQTETIMLDKLTRQIDGSEWSWNNLNTLCWAVGSISGAMVEEEEKKFLVTVIKDLLHLCEMKRGKDNKAVVASNIMYVVGQYPRFLRAHWKFLKTVVNKLFEFMHETHPGVQDMACDTFLTIAQKCKKKFVTLQLQETRPFMEEILDSLQEIINELEPHQIQSFYESCGHIIAFHTDENQRRELVRRLFILPNESWQNLISAASASQDSLRQRDTMKNMVNILKTNSRVAASMGSPYLTQLKVINVDMMKLYHVYSDMILAEVATSGPMATKKVDTRSMRMVKKEVLRLIEAYLGSAEANGREVTLSEVIEPLSEPILSNYYASIPEARDAEVLSLFAQIVSYMGGLPVPAIRLIFKSLVGVTLDMIRNNFEDFPDARLNFFKLLRAINQNDYQALFQLDDDPARAEEEFRLVINAIVWAFKHTEKNVAETGLQILFELLQNVDRSAYANYFYKMYFKLILNEILAVLVDTLHKPGFKRHAQILMHMISAVTSGRITDPIWDGQSAEEVAMASAGAAVPSNPVFLKNHLLKLLRGAFANMSESQILVVAAGMTEITDERTFKGHLRDFLVQTKEFCGGDNTDLFDEEKQAQQADIKKQEAERLARTPGLIAPVHVDDGMGEQ